MVLIIPMNGTHRKTVKKRRLKRLAQNAFCTF